LAVAKYFKQLNIYANINNNCRCLDESRVKFTKVELEIISTKIINTIEGISLEQQILSGKKLIVVGNLSVQFFLCTHKHHKKGYWIDEDIPFSTFIVIPKEICTNQRPHITHTIEDVTTKIITKGKIFISITFLLEYQEEY